MQVSEFPRAVAAACRRINTWPDGRGHDRLHDRTRSPASAPVTCCPGCHLWRIRSHSRNRARATARRIQKPVAALDPRVAPRVYERDGFVNHVVDLLRTRVTSRDRAGRLRQCSRTAAMPVCVSSMSLHRNCTDRVEQAQQLVQPDRTPALTERRPQLLGRHATKSEDE